MLKRLKTSEPNGVAVGAAALILAAADFVSELAGSSAVPGGPVDEIAHVLTTLLVFWALGRGLCRRCSLLPALVASVAIDVDHIPGILGYDFFTEGTPRPYTHSLLTICVVLVGAPLWRSRRNLLLGIAAGLAIHFVRDLAEPGTGVALLWPVSDHSFSIAHAWYVVLMGAVVLIAGMRAVIRERSVALARRRSDARFPSSTPAPSP